MFLSIPDLWTCWEKLTFYQNFVAEHQIFSFENYCLGKKRRSKVVGAFKKFGGIWGAETLSDQSKSQTLCGMAVIDTTQWVSTENVWLFNVALLFNVVSLDDTFKGTS